MSDQVETVTVEVTREAAETVGLGIDAGASRPVVVQWALHCFPSVGSWHAVRSVVPKDCFDGRLIHCYEE